MIKKLLFSIISIAFLIEVDAATCLTNWKYSTDITVTNPNAGPYTNFQIKVIVNTQALISVGKMKANGDDIRFTDGTCNNLHYWIDSNLNTTTTVIWIKLKSMAGGGSSKIFMYYGNFCANAAQNGDSTFVFFDDFASGSLNVSKWNNYKTGAAAGTLSFAGGRISIATSASNDNVIRSVPTFSSPITLESKIIANSGSIPNIAQLNSGTFAGVSLFTGAGGASNNFNTNSVSASAASYVSANNNSGVARANGVWNLKWSATNAAQGIYPGGNQNIVTTPALSANVHVAMGISVSGIGSITADWLRARKYAPLEPGTAVGAELAQTVTVKFSPKTAICPGDSISVTISKKNIYFNTGNIFSIQLSDAAGAFGSPTTLRTYTDTIGKTIKVRIPRFLTASSNYRLRVTTTNAAYTCFTSDSTLNIKAGPTAAFSFVNDNQCFRRNLYNFTSTSNSNFSGSISKHIWLWQDGSTDTLTTLTANHKFKTYNAFYYPKLKVVSNLGCEDTISKKVLIKESPNVSIIFNDTIQCLRGNSFIITSTSTVLTGSINAKNWNAGDGGANINGVNSFTKKYLTSGFFAIKQYNTHSNGCIDTGTLSVAVNAHPIAQIITNDTSQCITNNAFVFESASTITNGLPLINNWNIGNGITFDSKDSVHHTYPTIGNRNVQLVTYSDDGIDACYDTTYQLVEVNPIPKVIIRNYDIELCSKYNSFRLASKSTIASGTITNNWNFGDMTSANAIDSTNHTYISNGAFTIELKSISDKGCADSVTTTVTVRPTPTPSFTINQIIQCAKYNLFKLKNTSSIASGTYGKTWLMGDGNQYGNIDSIEHHYAADGKYNISLILQSNYNCKDTLTDSLFAIPNPVSTYVVNIDNQCLRGNAFNFTDNSTFASGIITGNKWLFDDGNIALNIPNPTHTYLSENTYNSGLIVYGDNGCEDTSFIPLNVNPHAGTDFLINDTGQCLTGNSFVFTSNTFISGTGTFTNKWLFGDGTSSLQFDNVVKKYFKDSTFIVTNVSVSDNGCLDTARKTVTVFPKPKASYTINNDKQCRLGNLFDFTATTTIKKGTFTNSWSFGDNIFANLVNNVQHSYANAQVYNSRLIASSNEGCNDTLIKPVRTYAMPVANFKSNYLKSCLKGNNFSLQATSTVLGGTLMSHNWYYGDDSSTINSQFVNHTYLKDSNFFNITLISSTNIGGCKDTIVKPVTLYPMPVANFTIDNPEQCFLNHIFNFNSNSTIKNTDTLKVYSWLFGDNTSASVPSISHVYTKVDSFKVSLSVTTNNGCLDSISKKVYINPMPVADFTITPKESCLRNNKFTATNKSNINKGIIAIHRWKFNTNDSSLLQTPPVYSYTANGTYIIELKTTSNKGCWDTATAIVNINPNPTLAFTVDPVCLLKDSSDFINNSTINVGIISSFKWKFGNGKVSSLSSPKHLYKKVGNYDITLSAITDKGCKDTIVKLGEAIVNPLPTAKFDFKKLRSFENEVDIQFIDSSKNAVSWLWNFGAQGISTDQEPILYYTDTVTQRSQMIVTNIYGCKDTSTRYVFIAPDVIYYMANAFTPNGDNINEKFKPVGLAFAKSYKFIIFNRWGEILFKTDNPQVGWDGKFEGELVTQGLYFYRLEFIGADDLRHEEENSIMILR